MTEDPHRSLHRKFALIMFIYQNQKMPRLMLRKVCLFAGNVFPSFWATISGISLIMFALLFMLAKLCARERHSTITTTNWFAWTSALDVKWMSCRGVVKRKWNDASCATYASSLSKSIQSEAFFFLSCVPEASFTALVYFYSALTCCNT